MANTKEIKGKIASIKNMWKITKAMEIVSTVKMKRAQDLALEKRNFVLEMLKIFLKVEEYLKDFPIFSAPKNWKKTLAVMITSNKWLCGGYNVNVMKKVNSYLKETKEEADFIVIWKRASNFIAKTWGNILADFSDDFTDHLSPIFTKKISELIREEFLSGKYSKVVIFYNFFVNTIKQISVANTNLPISSEEIKSYLLSVLDEDFKVEDLNIENTSPYEIEPNPWELAQSVIPMILDMMFFDTLLNAKASEHSARMIAMKNAKDAATKISGSLTLRYNKARQAGITNEVSEITSGVESMKEN